MNQTRFTKLFYVLLLFVLVACQAQATSVPTMMPLPATAVPPIAAPTIAAAPNSKAFSSKIFGPHMSISFGSDWSVQEEYPDVLTLISDKVSVDLAFIVVKDAKIADPKSSFAQVAFPDDFVNWIKDHGLFPVLETKPVVVAGFQGTQIIGVVSPDCGDKRDWL